MKLQILNRDFIKNVNYDDTNIFKLYILKSLLLYYKTYDKYSKLEKYAGSLTGLNTIYDNLIDNFWIFK